MSLTPIAPLHEEVVSAEACEILEIDRSTLTRWVKRGLLTPSRKLPGTTGAYLFRRAEVDRAKAAS